MNFPDLSSAQRISIDCETFDPAISAGNGSGALKGGYVAGISIGTDDGFREYYPIKHHQGDNLDPTTVFNWLKTELAREHQEKVFANAIYDLEYLAVAGVRVVGRILDVQIAEPLLDENQYSYALEVIAQKYLGEGKIENDLKSYCIRTFGCKENKWKEFIWKAPGHIVREYAIGDIDLPLRIIDKQLKLLEEQDLLDLFYMESDLIPMMLAMKLRGVRVDLKKAEEVYADLSARVAKDQAILGPNVNVNAGASLATVWERNGLSYPLTEKTKKPSFTKESLAACGHPVARLVESIRTSTKLRDTFIKNAIMEQHINGRIHSTFNQLKSDDKGTVSGRFSSSNPNLQQVPARGEGTELIRQIFIPEPDEVWYSIDYSQIEYRCFAHYAEDETILEAYQKDSNTDFHQQVSELLGGTLDRKVVKRFNFGILYGAGFYKIATMLRTEMTESQIMDLYDTLGDIENIQKFNRSVAYKQKQEPYFKPDMFDITAFRVLEVYDEKFPAAKKLMEAVGNAAKQRGYIYTLLKRRRRFQKNESTHKALNALLQGSAADIMKQAMVNVWKSGVCDVLGAPLLTVHDELNLSVPNTKSALEAVQEVRRLMENAIRLQVPTTCDFESGPDWGHVE